MFYTPTRVHGCTQHRTLGRRINSLTSDRRRRFSSTNATLPQIDKMAQASGRHRRAKVGIMNALLCSHWSITRSSGTMFADSFGTYWLWMRLDKPSAGLGNHTSNDIPPKLVCCDTPCVHKIPMTLAVKSVNAVPPPPWGPRT